MADKESQAPLSKREKFEQAGRFPIKKVAIIGVAAVIVIVGAVLGYYFATTAPAVGGEVVEEGGVDYAGGTVEMVALSAPAITADTIELSAAEIREKKIGGFVYYRDTAMPAGYDNIEGNGLPVLAYVSPSGRLVVASSLCEPCHSYVFHIEDDNLVCNACFTRWKLDTLEAVSGGCQIYPPEELETVVDGDKVIIQKSVLETWVPRV